ncbi:MAG: 5'-nucleotidase C-terminal domain-containing protein, partial [Bacteroidia bacterium]
MYKNFSPKIKLGFAAVMLLVASCSKHLYVQQTQPQHFIINDNTVDSQIVKTINPYKQSLDGKMHEVIGVAPVSLTKKTPESNLGNFFSEAIFDRVKSAPMIYENMDTTNMFAMFNNGGLRTSVPQGNIMVGSMFELMPFENKLVVVKLSGERTLKLLNFIA